MATSASIYSPGLWNHTKEDENAVLAPMYLCNLFEKTHRVNNLNSNGNEHVTKCQLSGICCGCIRGYCKPVRQESDFGFKDQLSSMSGRQTRTAEDVGQRPCQACPRDSDQQAQAGQRTLAGVEQIGARWEVGLEEQVRERTNTQGPECQRLFIW